MKKLYTIIAVICALLMSYAQGMDVSIDSTRTDKTFKKVLTSAEESQSL